MEFCASARLTARARPKPEISAGRHKLSPCHLIDRHFAACRSNARAAFLLLRSAMIKHFAANTAGRDFVVGDIHGCFRKLEVELATLGFDPECDRMFSVGDLVDRGPDSEIAIEWLEKPWFHAVRGNHEQMAIDCANGNSDTGCYLANGGAWFLAMTRPEQRQIADAFSALPIALEVETPMGIVGVVHANCPFQSWDQFKAEMAGERADLLADICMWDRSRAINNDASGVAGVSAVYVGHTPMKQSLTLGNVRFIDTGAVFGNKLTIVQIN
jgi:serine/threonine protein phosphatase 1